MSGARDDGPLTGALVGAATGFGLMALIDGVAIAWKRDESNKKSSHFVLAPLVTRGGIAISAVGSF